VSDPPPLPESDNPFVVLGVERGCGERELKLAYARLVRLYRPDRMPREFQRVQAAYEAAAAGAATFRHDEVTPPADEGKPGTSRDTLREFDAQAIERILASDDVAGALAIVNEPGFDRAADHDTALRTIALRVACVAVWAGYSEDADSIHHRHAHGDFHDWWETVYDDRRGLLDAWLKWNLRHRKPLWLPRLLQFADSIHEEDLVRFVPRPCGRPRALLKAFDRMAEETPRLVYACVRGLDEEEAPEEESLTDAQRRALERLRRRAGRNLWLKAFFSRIGWFFLILYTLGLGLVFLVNRNRKNIAAERYREAVRPLVFKLAHRHDVSPALLSAWLRRRRPRSRAAGHADAIDRDLALRATWLVLRLSRLPVA
jgi:hypothetical protein